MNKNVMNFVAIVMILLTISCKKQDEMSNLKLDENNMILPHDATTLSPENEAKNMEDIANAPIIEFENKGTFDFGTINEGEKVTHIFKFKNIGKNDLKVINAQPSCGCTAPEWTKEPIKSGETGEIKIIFNSTGKPGKQNKSIKLTTNTEAGNEILSFQANVTPKPITEEEKQELKNK